MSYDESRDRLQELAGWHVAHAGDRNEATTRLHLIDQIFLACLSWAREDLVLEERFDGQYADYVLYAPRRLLIVEAKREGDYFEIPAGEARLERSLPTLCHDYPQLKAALEQVASYCQARGVPLGCVSNGHQLVAFVATRNDGTPPLDGRAIVFGSLQQMLDHFLELWQSLSKPGVLEGHLQTRLLSQTCRPIPAPLSTAIPHYPGIQRRNSFQTELQILSELILEDVGRTRELEPRFLAETYCESGALSQYALTTKAILRTRYAALFDADQPAPTIMPATTKDGVSPELLAESLGRRPILLLGDVGVGKTMFIRHLVKVDAASLFTDAIALYLDFGSKGAFTNDLFTFVSEDLVR